MKPQSNTTLLLPKLRPYLHSLHNIQLEQRAEIAFDGKCSPRINNKGSILPELALLMGISGADVGVGLMDFELWVSQSLDSWHDEHIKSTKHMIGISRLINWYISQAISVYTESPDGFPVMILTVMLLWVALDKSTISHVSYFTMTLTKRFFWVLDASFNYTLKLSLTSSWSACG